MCFVNVALGRPVCFGVSKIFMEIWPIGTIFKFFGAFPIKSMYKNATEGTVNRIVEHLQHHKDKTFLISPEGDTDAAPWKSGFYHISRLTRLPVVIGGIDYVHHTIGVNPKLHWPPQEHSEEAKMAFIQELQQDFRTCGYYPLYPEASFPEIAMPDNFSTTAFDYGFTSTIVGGLTFLYFAYPTSLFWPASMLASLTVLHHFPHKHSYNPVFSSNIGVAAALLALAYYQRALVLLHPFRAFFLFVVTMCCKVAGNGYYTNCCITPIARFHALYHLLSGTFLGLLLSLATEPQLP